MPRLETSWGTRAENREQTGIPDLLSCPTCDTAVPKVLCIESINDIDLETLSNLKKSGIESFTKQFGLHCPKCSSQIYGILLE